MDEKNDNNTDIYFYKIVLLGEPDVRKNSLIIRFSDNTNINEDNLTFSIGLDMKTKFVKRNNKKIELQICDTAGQERFRSLAKNCIN